MVECMAFFKNEEFGVCAANLWMVECMAVGKSLKELYPNYVDITKVLSLSSRDEEMEDH